MCSAAGRAVLRVLDQEKRQAHCAEVCLHGVGVDRGRGGALRLWVSQHLVH